MTRLLQSVLVVPLTTNLDRANLAGTALIGASEGGLAADSVALAFQMRAIPRKSLKALIRALTSEEVAELDLATDEALGRVASTPSAPSRCQAAMFTVAKKSMALVFRRGVTLR